MELQQWMTSLGFNFLPILDGKRHRCDENGTNKSDHIWYIGSTEMVCGGKDRTTLTIGNWKTDEQWYYTSGKASEYTEEERRYYAKKQKEASEKADAEKRAGQEKACAEAEKVWNSGIEISEWVSDYIQKKQIGPEALRGIKRTHDGALLIPMRDIDGKLWGIQRIFPDGTKLFLKGQKVGGLFFKIGEQTEERFFVCEGFATGVSVYSAFGGGCCVVVCFNANNLKEVAGLFKERRPVLCGDDDRWNPSEKNVGREKAIEAANEVGGIAVFPEFRKYDRSTDEYETVPLRPTDFNDLHVLEGLDEVRRQITKHTGSNSQNESRIEFCESEGNNEDKLRESDETNEQDRESGEGSSQTKREPKFPIEALGPYMSLATQAIAEKTSAPVELVCSSILAGAAICVQPLYDIEAFGSVRPISLYFLTIAESGERKTTVDKIVLSEHYKWAAEKWKKYTTEKSVYDEEIEEWSNTKDKNKRGRKPIRPKAPMIFVEEPTVEGLFACLKNHRSSVGLFSDEGGGFLSGHSMKQENVKSTLAKLNQLWDGSPITRMRKGKDEGDMDRLSGKRVSLHLMMQPKLARELFNNEYAKSQGFLARCLTCEPKSKIGERQFLYNVGTIEEAKGYYAMVRSLLEKPIPERPAVLVPTLEALKLIEAFYYEIEPMQVSGGELAGIRDFASKVVEHCIRMAAVITAFNCDNATTIESEAMSGAIEIGRFYLSMQSSATDSSATFPSRDCEIMYEFLTKKSVWNTRDLLRTGPKRFRKRATLYGVLSKLSEAGFCRFDAAEHKVTL